MNAILWCIDRDLCAVSDCSSEMKVFWSFVLWTEASLSGMACGEWQSVIQSMATTNLIVKCSLDLDTSTINIEVSILPATAWVQSTQFPLNSIYRSSSADTRDTDEWKTSQHVFDVIQGLLSCVTNSKYDFYFPSNSFTPSSKLSCST